MMFNLTSLIEVRQSELLFRKECEAICMSKREAKEMVGASGFEPPTSRSRTVRSTRLSHAPTRSAIWILGSDRGYVNGRARADSQKMIKRLMRLIWSPLFRCGPELRCLPCESPGY